MTPLVRLIVRPDPALLVGALLLAVCTHPSAQDKKDINLVTLTVLDGASKTLTAGTLFRAYPDRREYVAEIAEDGKTNPQVKCASTEKFEAEAESKLDRPVAPHRIVCGEKLAFSFTRMFVTTFPSETATQLASSGAGPKVFAGYAGIFATAGKASAAKTWNDVAKFSAATNLGDAKTDKYLYRDPNKGFELVFNTDGVAALKEKQGKLGVKPTGMLDDETLTAFAKTENSNAVVAAMHCKVIAGGTMRFKCEPTQGVVPTSGPNDVILPTVALNKLMFTPVGK